MLSTLSKTRSLRDLGSRFGFSQTLDPGSWCVPGRPPPPSTPRAPRIPGPPGPPTSTLTLAPRPHQDCRVLDGRQARPRAPAVRLHPAVVHGPVQSIRPLHAERIHESCDFPLLQGACRRRLARSMPVTPHDDLSRSLHFAGSRHDHCRKAAVPLR